MSDTTRNAASVSPPAEDRHAPLAGDGTKTQREKFAEDLVYTLNHAVVCATTDVIDPFVGNWTQKYLGKRISIGHGHEHGDHHHHDHHHDHHHHDHHEHHTLGGNLKHWIIGEAVGDVGAVPFTVGLQYVAPGFMRGIQSVSEPVLGSLFNWSANHAAHEWAEKHGLQDDDPAVRERANELYQHEVEHLPHAFVWTGSAAGINILTQKIAGNKAPTWHMALGKLNGSLMTLAMVLGFRAFAPESAQRLDRFNSRHVAEPTTRWVSRLLGIDDKTVERVLEREREFDDGHQIKEKLRHRERHREHRHDEAHEPAPQVRAETAEALPPLRLSRLIG